MTTTLASAVLRLLARWTRLAAVTPGDPSAHA